MGRRGSSSANPPSFFVYDRGMKPEIQRGLKRIALVFAVSWCAIWGWVGWRGYEISSGATQVIDLQPPGAVISPILLEMLETGNRYLFDAVVVGALLPLGCSVFVAVGLWVYRGFKPLGHTHI